MIRHVPIRIEIFMDIKRTESKNASVIDAVSDSIEEKGHRRRVTQIHVILLVMALYMCGMGADVAGKQEKTVERWIRRIAPHCEKLIKQELSKHNHCFTSVYLQMDELWSYLWRKKTKVWI